MDYSSDSDEYEEPEWYDEDEDNGPVELNSAILQSKLQALKLQRDIDEAKEKAKEKAAKRKSLEKAQFHAESSKRKEPPTNDENKPPKAHHPQSGYLKVIEEGGGHTPDSEVIVSGTCSPGSEGVRRADRKDVHHFGGACIDGTLRK